MAEPEQASTKIKHLYEAIGHSREVLKKPRENQVRFIKDFVGSHYSTKGSDKPIPINYIRAAVEIYTQYLVSANPQVLINSPAREQKPIASLFELEMNQLVKEINLANTLSTGAQNSMFTMGIVKVGMMPAGKVEIEGTNYDTGEPYAKTFNFDDWVQDMSAKTLQEAAFMGHKYRVPLDWVKTSGMFKNTDDLHATRKDSPGMFGSNEASGIEVRDITGELDAVDRDEYRQYIELWDIWLPFERKTVTLRTDGLHAPLRETEWWGPESGPYHILKFQDVPNSSFPLAPVTMWKELHDLGNTLYRKLGRQGENQKENLIYDAQAAEMVTHLKNAADGVALKGRPDQVTNLKTGGPDPQNMALLLQNDQFFMGLVSGNIESIGGLGALSETVGQDKMIRESASVQVQIKQNRMNEFATGIVKSLAWYRWNDPLLDRQVVRNIKNIGSVVSRFTPVDSEADFLDFNFSIQPYSLQQDTPSMKLQKLMMVLGQVITPMLPMMQEQGISLNIENVLRDISRYGNLSDVDDWLTFAEPPLNAQRGTIQPRQAAQTTRTNIRENRSASTGPDRRQSQIKDLIGQTQQQSA